MSLDFIQALGRRIERELFASNAKTKTASTASAAVAATPFVLPTSTPGIDLVPTTAPASTSDISVGDTFRRKGMLSDVPMTVSRIENGSVYASFSDGATSQEMAFDASDVDIVSKAPTIAALPNTQYVNNLIDAVRNTVPLAAAPATISDASTNTTSPESAIEALAPSALPVIVMADSAPSVAAVTPSPVSAASETATRTTASATTTTVAAATSVKAADIIPDGAIRLPDGTLQFGYAPTGGVSHAPSVQAPVPAEFGVGATFRRKGVADTPMTVTSVGDGVISAMMSFTDGSPSRMMAFVPDQLDLVTRAPGS